MQPFLEALHGYEVIGLTATPALSPTDEQGEPVTMGTDSAATEEVTDVCQVISPQVRDSNSCGHRIDDLMKNTRSFR